MPQSEIAARLRAEWDANGDPTTLAAAALDANEWLELIERKHNDGQWKLNDASSIDKLHGCRQALIRLLAPELPERLRALADEMTDAAAAMDYYGGFAEWSEHGRELAGAAGIVREWAEEITKQEE